MNASTIALLISACAFIGLAQTAVEAVRFTKSPPAVIGLRAFLAVHHGVSSFEQSITFSEKEKTRGMVQPMLVAAGTKFCWEK